MATREQCPYYDQCGFVAWRRDRVSVQSEPLPSDGDCGKILTQCGRYTGKGPASLTAPGPETRDELDIAYPPKTNSHGRPEKRIFGSGSR
jgi:hypothetical protein